jgi:hypothetical protein
MVGPNAPLACTDPIAHETYHRQHHRRVVAYVDAVFHVVDARNLLDNEYRPSIVRDSTSVDRRDVRSE